MMEISKEYGTALFMLACEKNQKQEYAAALETVKTAFLETPAYLECLYSPGLSLQERLASLDAAFLSQIPADVLSFLKLLCEKGRIKGFFEIADAYGALLAESERVLKAKVTSAVALTEEEKERLRKKLEAVHQSRVNMEYLVDASLMGGVIVEVDGKVLDGSLKRRLHKIKEVIST